MTTQTVVPAAKGHQKLNYINVFRAIAILWIVAGHSFSGVDKEIVLGKILNEFFQNGTVLFVFIAGFLFQYLSDKFSYRPYLKKKFFNVVLPYLITSVIGITLRFLFPQTNPFAAVSKWLQVPMFLTTGWVHNAPTWYIPMTCVFFLAAFWLLRLEYTRVFNKKSLLFCCLPILLLIPLCIPRYEWAAGPGLSAEYAWSRYVLLNLFSCFLFFPVYILGMFFAARPQFIDKLYEKRHLLLGCFLLTALIICTGFYVGVLTSRMITSKIFITLWLLGVLKHYDCKIVAMSRFYRRMDVLATYSFSIFFFHYYFLMIFSFIMKYVLDFSTTVLITDFVSFMSWFGIGICKFLWALLGSLFLAMFLKKILTRCGIKNTRWFIGA